MQSATTTDAGSARRPCYNITIFIVPPSVAKTVGRYVCLMRSTQDNERWIAEDSLVSSAKELNDDELDWTFIENALLKEGIWSS